MFSFYFAIILKAQVEFDLKLFHHEEHEGHEGRTS